MTAFERRVFLRTALWGTASAALIGGSVLRPVPALGRSRKTKPAIIKLGDSGMAVVTGLGGNVLVAPDGEGLLMVDSGDEHSPHELKKLVLKEFGGRKVHTLFNTHWHLEHTGGNERFAKDGARIVAHEYTRQWMGTEVYINWQNRTYEPRPKLARPTETFMTDGQRPFRKGFLKYGPLARAHTDSDIYVFFPDENVVVTGGVVSVGEYPILDYVTGGWIGEMLEATNTLLALTNENTVIVPGHGPVQNRAHLQAEHDMLSTVLDRMRHMLRKGLSADEMIAQGITKEYDATWGDPTLFMNNAYQGIYGHLREMRIA